MIVRIADQPSPTYLNLDHVLSVIEHWNGSSCDITTVDGTEYVVNTSARDFMVSIGMIVPREPADASQ